MTSEPVSIEPPDPKDDSSAGGAAGRLEALKGDSEGGRGWLRWALPLVALLAGVALYAALVATRERPETREIVPPPPLVRVMTATPEDLRLTVLARGTVAPRTESDLVAEVRGRVVWISPDLVVGGLFEKGDELLRLDDREYRIARDRARASVTLRESEARLAASEASRRRQLRERGAASAADLEQFENRELVARASLDEARAAYEQAELDYERTVVRAPFAGRVRERIVDVGRFVSPGTKLGRVFAVDYAEVRLPIQTDDLAFLDVDLQAPGMGAIEGARVALTGRLGGRDFTWPARLDRAEAAIDEETRMLHVVARVDDPYALGEGAAGGARVPLPSGLFVTAEIEGRAVSDVFVLPMMALRDGNQVFVAEPIDAPVSTDGVGGTEGAAASDTSDTSDASEADVATRPMGREARLGIRKVSVLRRDRERVVIDAGIEAGDQILISPLRIYSDGMSLRLVEAKAP